MKKIPLIITLALVLTIGLVPADIVHANSGVNYAYSPNSGEASLSRVDLISMTEVARYYTAPRLGDEVDLLGNPTPGTPNTIDPYDWRSSRIVIDSSSNAWVINTGADGTNLQGSIVRIQADTTGLTTHTYPDPVMDFGTDEAVQVYAVGAPGDMPRAIAIDSDGYIWVGFYSGAQLMKYEYHEATKTLTAIAGPFFPDITPNNVIRYYDMDFAPDGTLFISSRGSTPTRTPRQEGIWTFNPATEVFTRETTWNPYAVLMSDDGTVYATAYSSLLYTRDKDTGLWSSVTITGSSQNRGMTFDAHGRIWIASTVGTTSGTVVYSYDIVSGTPGPTYTLTSGTTPVGVGKDAAGNIWIVCRSDAISQGWLEGFDPVTLASVGEIQVGYRPYAYRDFVAPFEALTYRICGYKYEAGVTRGLQGWEIILERLNEQLEPPGYEPFHTTTTGAGGKYCFYELPAGTYRVSESVKPGWRQVEPANPGHYIVDLPNGASQPDEGPFYNFENEPPPPPSAGAAYPIWTVLLAGVGGGIGLLMLRRRSRARDRA